jgi:hypothetical protein
MPPESWLVLTVAGAFLLLGIAGSPLAWVLLYHRRSRSEEIMDKRCRKLADELRGFETRLARLEAAEPDDTKRRGLIRAGSSGSRGTLRVDSANGPGFGRTDLPSEPRLIAVPNLEAAPQDRDITVSGLKERHAAIWALADSGSAPEVIARATGQPIGQIELILGLRRQIDGTRAQSSHSSAHA